MAAQIFELQNSRGVELDLIEKVKARLMKEVYLHSSESSSDDNIKEVQDNFSRVYQLEEKTTESSFRGELKLDNILFRHLRVIDDGFKKEESDFHSPSNTANILKYIGNKLNGKNEPQCKVDYILNLSCCFKNSIEFVCEKLIELDTKNPLVGDCLILDRNNSLEFFLLLLHNDRFNEVYLKKWERLLFTRDFHSRYYKKNNDKRDNFQLLYQEILGGNKIEERLGHYINHGFRDDFNLQEAFQKDVIEDNKEDILTDAYGYHYRSRKGKDKIPYILYKYEIEKKGNPKESGDAKYLRDEIRKYFKKGRSIEHILPQNWSSDWTDLKEELKVNAFRKEINGVINGIGNLLIINTSENSRVGNEHPKDKDYTIKKGSYIENKEKWADSEEWKSLIETRGEKVFEFMKEYFCDNRYELRATFKKRLYEKLKEEWICVSSASSAEVPIDSHVNGNLFGFKWEKGPTLKLENSEKELHLRVEFHLYAQFFCGLWADGESEKLEELKTLFTDKGIKLEYVYEKNKLSWIFLALDKYGEYSEIAEGVYRDEYNISFTENMDNIVGVFSENIKKMSEAWREICEENKNKGNYPFNLTK